MLQVGLVGLSSFLWGGGVSAWLANIEHSFLTIRSRIRGLGLYLKLEVNSANALDLASFLRPPARLPRTFL